MERLRDTTSTGLSRSGIRAIAMVLMALGIVGRSIFQNRLLGLATISLVLQCMEACGVPLFAFLLVEGFQHTSNLKNYVLRVAGVAVLSELPYNLAMSGKLWDTGTRNPVFAMVVGLIMLYMYQYYSEKTVTNALIKALVTVAALIWPVMLSIDFGVCLVILVCVLWAFRRKPLYRNIAGATASVVCSLTSPFFLAAPMSFLVIHFSNGEIGNENRKVNYLAYPVLLLVIGLLAKFI